jgi:hypothetical protein
MENFSKTETFGAEKNSQPWAFISFSWKMSWENGNQI